MISDDGEASFSSVEELSQLLQGHEPLYAVLDAARDPAIRRLLVGSGDEARSLYDGRRGEQLADIAPYLARVPIGSPLFDALIREGWGNGWGVLLVCGAPFAELRRHLRRYLVVQTEDRTPLYLRFYDPRVLGPFLATLDDEQRRDFFGPIDALLFEGRRPGTLLRRARVGPPAPRPEPPWELFTVREELLEAFAQETTERFLERMAAKLRVPVAQLRAELARADRHGVTSEAGLERYLAISAALGPAFDERIPWARAELAREDADEERKLRRIERRLRRSRLPRS